MKSLVRAVVVTIIALTLCLGIWKVWGRVQGVSTGESSLPTADQRTVENVACSGEPCGHVKLSSDQEPGTIFFVGMLATNRECFPVTLWANRIREGQIGIGGYGFVEGGQTNLRPVTVDESALQGDAVDYPIIFTASTRATLHVTLRDDGDWNLIDSLTVDPDDGGAGAVLVTAEYADGTKTLWNGCGESGKETVTYVLYQSPELVWPGQEQTYLVSIVRRGEYGASTEDEDVTIFQRVYTQSELEADSISVEAVDGDVTLTFDLVKE